MTGRTKRIVWGGAAVALAVAVQVAARQQAAGIVDLALDDDGAAITHAEAEGRRTALRDLATAARHALVAACSPEVWPPE